ncbi:MAG: hypothetical protein CV089_20120 [Nitrospira sp. WS110]|nr:hypothetical protein [Nitrospira sp. WS110]
MRTGPNRTIHQDIGSVIMQKNDLLMQGILFLTVHSDPTQTGTASSPTSSRIILPEAMVSVQEA